MYAYIKYACNFFSSGSIKILVNILDIYIIYHSLLFVFLQYFVLQYL